jgi:ribosomal protein L19E
MPICFISIQPKYLLEEMQYEIKEKWNDTEYWKQRNEYGKIKEEIKLGKPPCTSWMKGIRNLRATLPKLPTIT